MCYKSFIVVLTLIEELYSAQINYIKVPIAVKNNANRSIILDCDYSVRPGDQELVVKWYLNDDIVYQWIPPHKPQSLGLLLNRLDLNYKASGDPKTVYRAMKILNPTIDIAGEYKCFVSTVADEDYNSKRMIVFEPESSLKIKKIVHVAEYVNFTCEALNVYPQPKITMYEGKRDDYHKKNPLDSFEWDTKKENGIFSVYLSSTARTTDLQAGDIIHCELRIPGTGYVKRTSFLYYPLDMDVPWNGSFKSSSTIFTYCFLAYFLMK